MGYKNIVAAFFLLGLSFHGVAQGIPIQLMIVDSDGFEMPNKQVKLRLTLRNDTSLTTGQYQEVHFTQSNDFGIVSESLGGGVVTTNSSVYALSEFNFNATEPMIKIELDTTALSNQYYTVGTLVYSYPLVSRRALRSDSADYADTTEYARNFDESLDNDTSSQNEIQLLNYNEEDKTITISKGNSIDIGINSFLEIEGSLLSVSNDSNWHASQWIAADSLYIYSVESSTQLKKALISNPDSAISVINVGFPIEAVFPKDSLVVGVDNAFPVYSVYACGLDGSNSISKNIGAASERISSDGWRVKDRNVSYIVSPTSSSSSTWYSYVWALDSNTLSNIQDFNVYFSNDFVFKHDTVFLKIINRWDQAVLNRFIWNDFTGGKFYPDTSGVKSVKQEDDWKLFYYDNMPSPPQAPLPSGSFRMHNIWVTYSEIDQVYGVVKADWGDSRVPGFHQLYLINLTSIGTESTVSKLIMDNWTPHSESSGSYPHIIKGFGEILIIFSDVKNFWIDGAYRSGSFIYRVPLN